MFFGETTLKMWPGLFVRTLLFFAHKHAHCNCERVSDRRGFSLGGHFDAFFDNSRDWRAQMGSLWSFFQKKKPTTHTNSKILRWQFFKILPKKKRKIQSRCWTLQICYENNAPLLITTWYPLFCERISLFITKWFHQVLNLRKKTRVHFSVSCRGPGWGVGRTSYLNDVLFGSSVIVGLSLKYVHICYTCFILSCF